MRKKTIYAPFKKYILYKAGEKTMNKKTGEILFLLGIASFFCMGFTASDDTPKTHKFSKTVEKERPQLNEETRRLIAAYRENPTEENRAALRKQIEKNYDNVIARKTAKLEELKRTARHESKILEMQRIVDEVVQDKENRIEQSMRRFTDPRRRPGARQTKDGYLPVLGAAQNVEIAYAPVTKEEYAVFLKQTDRTEQPFPAYEAKYPATNISYHDAVAYARWLSEQDERTTYRLPTEKEWELAAGHMPKDAEFNNGIQMSISAVDAYKNTLSASGAIDMWGNCWEWTSTSKNGDQKAVKGGSFDSPRLKCRTEERAESRDPAKGYHNVCFRLIREK